MRASHLSLFWMKLINFTCRQRKDGAFLQTRFFVLAKFFFFHCGDSHCPANWVQITKTRHWCHAGPIYSRDVRNLSKAVRKAGKTPAVHQSRSAFFPWKSKRWKNAHNWWQPGKMRSNITFEYLELLELIEQVENSSHFKKQKLVRSQEDKNLGLLLIECRRHT